MSIEEEQMRWFQSLHEMQSRQCNLCLWVSSRSRSRSSWRTSVSQHLTDSVPRERKKTHDKIYPKGYVEMLEQQQAQLVSGLQEMYRRMQAGQGWDGEMLPESHGHPLTHDILAALNLVESKHDGGGITEMFEEDVTKIQARLIANGHGFSRHRRDSMSSDSEQSQHDTARSVAASTPVLSRPSTFRDSFHLDSANDSPLVQSPMPQRPSRLPTQRPTQNTSMPNDPSLYAPEWAQALSDAVSIQQKPQFAFSQTASPQSIDDLDLIGGQWTTGLHFDGMFNMNAVPQFTDLQNLHDMTSMDGMDVDFSKFVNPTPSLEVYN